MTETGGLDEVKAPDDLPRSPSGRIPAWVVDEQHGRRQDTAWRRYELPQGHPPPARRLRVARIAVVTLTIAALALAAVATDQGLFGFHRPVSPASLAPRPGHDEAASPLGRPVTASPGGTFAFTRKQDDGTPVAYDPCRPIHYVTRTAGVPNDGSALVRDAVQRLSAVTGLHFVDDGATDESPNDRRKPFQPDRYGDRWAPVLIAWQTPQENPDFAAEVAGEAGSQMVGAPGKPQVYVTGEVMLDAAKIEAMTAHPGGRAMARAIVLHELGHLVGLGHVGDPTQIMYPSAQKGVVDYGNGDLAGLSRLGAGTCAPWL